MDIQWAGVVLAVITFSTIGIGHVAVRKVNYLYGTKPSPYVFATGLIVLYASLITDNNLLSASLGIISITLLWDAYELIRQEERIRRGHAPENPKRPVEPRRKKRINKKAL